MSGDNVGMGMSGAYGGGLGHVGAGTLGGNAASGSPDVGGNMMAVSAGHGGTEQDMASNGDIENSSNKTSEQGAQQH